MAGVSKTVGKIAVEDILTARREVLSMHVSESLEEYLVQLIVATRKPENTMRLCEIKYCLVLVRGQR